VSADLKEPSDLAELLRRKVALLGELARVLEQETAGLAAAGHAPVTALAEEKRRLGTVLMELSQALDERLRQDGYEADAAGLARRVADAPDDAELRGLYDQAMQALRDCTRHNQTNGGLLERRRSAVDRALRLFFDDGGDASRYHPTGRLEGFAANRLIGSA
jgi:flagellar biosynthesis/type III secretory pathway chaperone